MEGDRLLEHRRLLVQQVYDRRRIKIGAIAACNRLSELAEKSVKLLNWADRNGVWCSVPDTFVASAEKSHRQIMAARNWSCGRIIASP